MWTCARSTGTGQSREPVDLYRAVVEAASGSGTAVEVSSQGLRKPVDEVYPAPSFLEMFNRAGVPITLASDGHAPDEAAWGHDEVVAAARRAGYTRSLRFRAAAVGRFRCAEDRGSPEAVRPHTIQSVSGGPVTAVLWCATALRAGA